MDLASLHHQEQKLIARNVVDQLEPVWNVLNPHELVRDTSQWLKMVRPIVERGFLASQYVAAEFVKNYRSTQLIGAKPLDLGEPDPLGPFGMHKKADRDVSLKIMVSMKVTGPGWVIGRSFQGMTPDDTSDLMKRGFSKSTGAATRIVLNGGRGVVLDLVQADDLARGVAGVADSTACNGCLFLTDPIMKSDGKRKMNAIAVGHDFCNCSAIPIY
jgi:hypothetical protein